LNIIDLCVIAVAASGLAIGYGRGLVKQFFAVAGLVIAYLAAYKYFRDVSRWIGPYIPWPVTDDGAGYGFPLDGLRLETYLNNAAAFLLLFIATKLACNLIGALAGIIVKAPGLNFVNKVCGALLGFAGSAILIVVAIHVMGAIPSEPLQQQLAGSEAARVIEEYLPSIVNPFHDLLNPKKPKETFHI